MYNRIKPFKISLIRLNRPCLKLLVLSRIYRFVAVDK